MKITIPPAALEAGARVICNTDNPVTMQDARDLARAAFEAMVGAWPGMHSLEHGVHSEMWLTGVVILPLTENPDAEA